MVLLLTHQKTPRSRIRCPFLLLPPRALGIAMSQAPACPTRFLHIRNMRMQLMSQLLKAIIEHRSKTNPPP